MTLSLFMLVLFCIAVESAHELCFKRAADGAPLQKLVKKPLIWTGIFLWMVEIIAWIAVLAHLPLSLAFPFMSLMYVATVAGAAWILKEKVGLRRVSGAALITAGVACLGVAGQ